MFKLDYSEEKSGKRTKLFTIKGFENIFLVIASRLSLNEIWNFEIYSPDGRFPKIVFPDLKQKTLSLENAENHFNYHIKYFFHKFILTIFENKLFDKI